ncbi:hypothetical protein WOLCODRAFT_80056 [Wolfiporia cocos MD-104 SS10]|uniref:Uncharacterized protein n=1 Tax=Wolfiporia cocos (strain MD-104) TaxID=742152 RepID=A0A2H3J921_WOLCO|nr:hypothetical protein WOLCODRAFT_80056 [Wolfiporia cocos MD-104 SS10]
MADVANLFVKLRCAQHRSKYQMHAECSSGEGPLTHKCLLGDGAVSLRRVPLAQETTFVCRDGVDVVKLLRLVRATMFEDAQSIGADVLVDEQWSCRICGPRQDGRTFKVYIRYSASAARSGRRDPQKPVALEGAHGVPGLMTVLDRLD